MSKLIFIDTNIFLDFYRFRSSDIGLKYLDIIDKNHDKIISTSQVEMEYKKHRTAEIIKTSELIKTHNWQSLTIPTILVNSEAATTIENHKNEIKKQQKILRTEFLKLLEKPQRNDKVFKTLQRLFRNKSDINLRGNHKEKLRIRELAYERFLLGQPPRKKDDTSIGDAINWEWIVRCASKMNMDVIIVSRDTDYGQYLEQDFFLNEWLSSEFRQRVGKKRKIYLTNKLSFAVKEAISKKSVTRKMETAEREVIFDSRIEKEALKGPTIEEKIARIKEAITKLKEEQRKFFNE